MSKNKFLDQQWLNIHLKQIIDKAGSRYTPELNIELPISEIFGGLSRTKSFYTSIRTHFGNLELEFSRISSKHENREVQRLYQKFSGISVHLFQLLREVREYDIAVIPWKAIKLKAQNLEELSWKLLDKLREEKSKYEQQKTKDQQDRWRSLSERLGSDIHYLHEVQKELRHFTEFASSTTARLSNHPFLLLTGLAGNGKTHLLCDLVKGRLKNVSPLPSILIFGEFFTNDSDLWDQIATQLGFNKNYNKSKILNLLNDAGKQIGARSLLIIDALNETQSINFWKKNLKYLQNEVKNYPHISLIISIRSGFEEEVFTKITRNLFMTKEHHGFQFREWEAVTKFFNECSLPLPEIPLLTPEFQNPLFLLLFCKAFESRSKQNCGRKKRQVFRGHEGATYVFENFVKSVANRIAKKFGLKQGRDRSGDYVIWDTVIEKVAAEMVEQNNDRIPEEKIIDIVRSSYPSVPLSSFIKELEKNLLVVRVPRYSSGTKKISGFDFRFPFQKFSDHLIGRFIFKKLRASAKTPRQFFGKGTRIGDLISWNRGIVEALSIQCPEWLKGIEFFDVAPHIPVRLLTEAFLESLIWRKSDAFTQDLKRTLWFINKHVIRTDVGEMLNTLLSVAPIPQHPFNALFLHRHLSKFTLPKRDSWWSTFLHYQYGEKGAVDRLIEWGWSEQDKTHIGDKPIELCSLALTWFFTSSNRFLRDKATKALVELLTDRLSVMIQLLEHFESVDDPYVLERLYAVAYGCSLRNRDDRRGLEKLAQWVYDKLFECGNLPAHILIRDYARGVIDVAVERGLTNIDRTKIIPPYKSSWRQNIPSEKILKKKYYPEAFFKGESEDRGYIDIWSSVMYNFTNFPGDFGKYKINPALSHWSGRRLRSRINRKMLFDCFKQDLTKEQQELLNFSSRELTLSVLQRLLQADDQNINEAEIKRQEARRKRERKIKVKQFKLSLDSKKRKLFENEIEPYLDERFEIKDPLDNFDSGLGQRWIFNRVVELGWNTKLHGQFDKNINYHRADRLDHKAERIGKKYQWIAFHELLALVSDNFEFKDEKWPAQGDPSKYVGPWQLGIRDIDPSCTLKDFPKQENDGTPTFERSKVNYDAWKRHLPDTEWLKETEDLPDPKQIIELIDQKTRKWLVLEGYFPWEDETPPERERYNSLTRRLWYMCKSYLVAAKDKEIIFDWIQKQNFYGRWMPESYDFSNVFLGEYPSAPSFLYLYIPYYNHQDWTDQGRNGRIPVKVLVTDDQYLSSGSSIDCSTQEGIRIKLPAKRIVDEMQLVQTKTDGRFFDCDGDLVAFDPTVFDKSAPSCILIRKDKFCDFLKQKDYIFFWIVFGEKMMIGGNVLGQPLGWLEISGTYTLDQNNETAGRIANDFKKQN